MAAVGANGIEIVISKGEIVAVANETGLTPAVVEKDCVSIHHGLSGSENTHLGFPLREMAFRITAQFFRFSHVDRPFTLSWGCGRSG